MIAVRTHSFDQPHTAAEAYAAEQKACLDLMAALSAKLHEHSRMQAQQPKNWGLVGDLQHLNHCLREALGEE